jgi:hypothetical protein
VDVPDLPNCAYTGEEAPAPTPSRSTPCSTIRSRLHPDLQPEGAVESALLLDELSVALGELSPSCGRSSC